MIDAALEVVPAVTAILVLVFALPAVGDALIRRVFPR